MSEPRLSVLMVTGPRRERVRVALDALAAQTAVDEIELILLDLGPPGDGIDPPGNLRMTRLAQPASAAWGSIRADGVRAARAPVVAFLEDHCLPTPEWGEMLLEAHSANPWATVGYAFLGGSRRWNDRAKLLAEYGTWLHPAVGGRTRILPGNNVSYKREPLLELGEELDDALQIDNNVHRAFEARGLEGAIEPRALVRHLELSRLWDVALANYSYGRLLAVGRAQAESWGLGRRLLFAIAVPLGAPVSRLLLLARGSRGGLRLAQLAPLLPGAAIVWLVSGIGQALGCLAGPGDSERRLIAWEVEAIREGDRSASKKRKRCIKKAKRKARS